MKFRDGGSWLVDENALLRYGKALIGRTDGQFIMTKSQMDNVLQNANGNKAYVEEELGIPDGLWDDKKIVRIDVRYPQNFNIRIPSGNEIGANIDWLPGEELPEGYYEAIVDQIPEGCYTVTPIKINDSPSKR